ncbi:MAG: DUF2062 domain-containing protein [Brachymonas sp.]|nr:DUF2062 domain-containing protein [Brachymonas sp.]
MIERLKRLMPKPETMANNRWLRWMGPSLLHPRLWHLSRRAVALGAAIGVFFAFITPIAQIPLSAAVSIVLRANMPAAVVATLVNTPPTFGPVYYAAWVVGSKVLGEKVDDKNRPDVLVGQSPDLDLSPQALTGWSKWMVKLQQVGKPLLLGALIFSVVFSALAYVLVNGFWHWRVRSKRKRRLHSRLERLD